MKLLTTVLDLLGLAVFVAGVCLVYVPAGVIVAGGGLLLLSWRMTAMRPAPRRVPDEREVL